MMCFDVGQTRWRSSTVHIFGRGVPLVHSRRRDVLRYRNHLVRVQAYEWSWHIADIFLRLFNFVVALTFPRLLSAFTPQGAFGWYAAWKWVVLKPASMKVLIGLPIAWLAGSLFCCSCPRPSPSPWKNLTRVSFLALQWCSEPPFFLTASLSCIVFNVPTHKQAVYGLKSFPHAIRKYLLRQKVPELPPLYDRGDYILSQKQNGEKSV